MVSNPHRGRNPACGTRRVRPRRPGPAGVRERGSHVGRPGGGKLGGCEGRSPSGDSGNTRNGKGSGGERRFHWTGGPDHGSEGCYCGASGCHCDRYRCFLPRRPCKRTTPALAKAINSLLWRVSLFGADTIIGSCVVGTVPAGLAPATWSADCRRTPCKRSKQPPLGLLTSGTERVAEVAGGQTEYPGESFRFLPQPGQRVVPGWNCDQANQNA